MVTCLIRRTLSLPRRSVESKTIHAYKPFFTWIHYGALLLHFGMSHHPNFGWMSHIIKEAMSQYDLRC